MKGGITLDKNNQINNTKSNSKKGNSVAKTLFTVGVLEIIIGIFIGAFAADAVYPSSSLLFLLYSFAGLVLGFGTIGLSEIIKLLQNINNHQESK